MQTAVPLVFTTVGDTEFPSAPVVPELDVADLQVSLAFYVGVIGFTVVFERQRERFAYLALERAELIASSSRGSWATAPYRSSGASVRSRHESSDCGAACGQHLWRGS
jgi:catechol 2,3-dioxygenase-like lactoylglutathione lyase family enzyme